MLTPAFDLQQCSNYLTIIIKAPFAKISETEVFVEENDFKFYSKPYFLRLTLPGNIVEDSREKGEYNAEKGVFTLRFPKETPGEEFEGLDMITKLLAPQGSTAAAPPSIEVIDDSSTEDGYHPDDDTTADEQEFDWSIEQTPYMEPEHPLDAPKYGFANQKSGVFSRLQEELCGIVDVPDPDVLSPADSQRLRLEAETVKFDENHYISDLYEDELILPLIRYTPPWVSELEWVQAGSAVDVAVELTESEKETMRQLPRREYLLEEWEERQAYLGLLDVMFAYCYNHRITEGENTVESGWTVSKISATLSWLEVFATVKDVVVSGFRRSLCYPLFRHWGLNMAVWSDVKQIFQLGRRRLLKCLLEVRQILADQDSRYVLNDLYITDYCVWIQSTSEKKIASFTDAVMKVAITKADVGLELPEVERLAAVSLEDDGIDTVTGSLAQMSVCVVQGTTQGSSGHDGDVSTDTDDVTTDTDDSSTVSDDANKSSDDESTGAKETDSLPADGPKSCSNECTSDDVENTETNGTSGFISDSPKSHSNKYTSVDDENTETNRTSDVLTSDCPKSFLKKCTNGDSTSISDHIADDVAIATSIPQCCISDEN